MRIWFSGPTQLMFNFKPALLFLNTWGSSLSLSPTKRRSRGNPRGGASPRVKKKRKETLRMRLSTLADHVSKPWFRETWNIFRCI